MIITQSLLLQFALQDSEWRWVDGAPVLNINWGHSFLYPSHDKIKARDPPLTNSLWIPQPKSGNKQELHCSGMEVFPDDSHVRLFPVIDCSAKYWSRILCENNTKIDKEITRLKFDQGRGEYWIANDTLTPAKFICPRGFIYNFITSNIALLHYLSEWRCMKLIFLGNGTLKEGYREACTGPRQSVNSNPLADIFTELWSYTGIGFTLYQILREFFPEGSYIACTKGDNYCSLPRNYPTYLTCFKPQEKVIFPSVNGVAVYKCKDGSLIAGVLLCNGRADCSNSEDEQQCSWEDSCGMFHYMCEGGGCVHYDEVCDSFVNCQHGDDETLCHK